MPLISTTLWRTFYLISQNVDSEYSILLLMEHLNFQGKLQCISFNKASLDVCPPLGIQPDWGQIIAGIQQTWTKIDQTCGVQWGVYSPNLRSVWWIICQKMHVNYSTNQRLAKWWERPKVNQALGNPPNLSLIPVRAMSANVQKLFQKSENRKQHKFIAVWWKVKYALGDPLWIHPSNLGSVQSVNCLQMHGNYSTNNRPGNNKNSVEPDQNLVRPGVPS